MKTRTKLENVNVYIVEGISKNDRPYAMLRVETGNVDLDNSLKPIFLNPLQLSVLQSVLNIKK